MNIWEVKILKIIASNDGTASLRHIYCELPKHVNLTNKHNEIAFDAPRYHHQTRAHIDDLMDSGDVIRIGRGMYSISSKGQLRIKEGT
ncbi:MAG: hypothetical protein Q7T53_11495 [Deltaproteobacteria bacterium]|nr:hypothetical protein [Deltaproteobacteria bacterium]